jgi:transcriptional regulator with XRE-family HTH domain
MSDAKKHSSIPLYKTYMFKDKDPVIDRLRTMVADDGSKYSEISNASGVSYSTLHNWFDGATRRPQYATIAAVAGALGYEMTFKKRHGNVVHFKKDRLKRHAG